MDKNTIDGLRVMADFLEANPEFTVYIGTFNAFRYEKEDFAAGARILGGKLQKKSDGNYYAVRREFGGEVAIELNISHSNLCEKIVETIDEPEIVIPAKPAEPEKIIPARTVEKIRWKCPESILALA